MTELGTMLAIHWWKAVIAFAMGILGFKFQNDYKEKSDRIRNLETNQNEMKEQLAVNKSEHDTLKSNFEKFLERHDRLSEDISSIKTDTAVIKNDIQHIKEDK